MLDWLNGTWALFASAFISSTLAPGGSEAVLAYLVSEKIYRPEWLVMVATAGNTLGAMTTWGLGLLAAKKFPLPGFLSEKQQKALGIIKSNGLWVLLFSWLPLIGDALCFAAGWLNCAWFPVAVLILVGKFARYAVIAWALL
jgi:membrane protein YqaA with SNARE-associated domain